MYIAIATIMTLSLPKDSQKLELFRSKETNKGKTSLHKQAFCGISLLTKANMIARILVPMELLAPFLTACWTTSLLTRLITTLKLALGMDHA